MILDSFKNRNTNLYLNENNMVIDGAEIANSSGSPTGSGSHNPIYDAMFNSESPIKKLGVLDSQTTPSRGININNIKREDSK